MKTLMSMSIMAVLLGAQGMAQAQAPAQATDTASKKAVTETTCKEYLEMDEVIKPKFIYYSVGQSTRGKPTSEFLDVVEIDQIQPVLEEYCRVNLTASAYQKVMNESKASEKTKGKGSERMKK